MNRVRVFEKVVNFLRHELPSPSEKGLADFLAFTETQLDMVPALVIDSLLQPSPEDARIRIRASASIDVISILHLRAAITEATDLVCMELNVSTSEFYREAAVVQFATIVPGEGSLIVGSLVLSGEHFERLVREHDLGTGYPAKKRAHVPEGWL